MRNSISVNLKKLVEELKLKGFKSVDLDFVIDAIAERVAIALSKMYSNYVYSCERGKDRLKKLLRNGENILNEVKQIANDVSKVSEDIKIAKDLAIVDLSELREEIKNDIYQNMKMLIGYADNGKLELKKAYSEYGNELKNAYSNYRNSLDLQREAIKNELKAFVDVLKSDLSDFVKKSVDVNVNMHITDLVNAINGISSRLANIENNINENKKFIDSLANEMSMLEKKLNDVIGALDSRLRELESRIADLEKKVSLLNAELSSLESRVAELETTPEGKF